MEHKEQKGYLWNLAEYLRRLGIQTAGQQPELLRSVQPVLISGDASSLTTPFIPALAWAGRLEFGTAGSRSGLAVRSNAPGGSFIRTLRASTQNSVLGDFLFEIGTTLHVFDAGGGTLTLFQMGPIDCDAVVRSGTTIAGLPSSRPAVNNSANQAIFTDEFYLAPGRELYIENNAVSALVDWAVLIQDVPVQIPGGD